MSTQPSSTPLTLVLGMAAILLLAGCSGHEPRSAGQSRDSTPRTTEQAPPAPRGRSAGEQAAVVAVRQIGVPYRYGGNNVTGFDCSGLVQYAYAAAGKELPRTTDDLWQQMQPVSGRNLEVGDVLFFNVEGKVSHVGLYLGSRRFVHAPATGREVTIADLDSDFYRNAFIRGGRPP
jgi:cell wall-associated NlpC family hydrolase